MPTKVSTVRINPYKLDIIWSVAISADCMYIVSGSSDRSIKVFSLYSPKELYHIKDAHDGRELL